MSEPLHLRAGAWTASFLDGDLWNLRIDGTLVISRIYAALRGDDWRTIPGAIVDLHCVAGPDSFQLSYRCEYRSEVIAYESQIELTGSVDGRIVVAMRGVARSDFRRNRI